MIKLSKHIRDDCFVFSPSSSLPADRSEIAESK